MRRILADDVEHNAGDRRSGLGAAIPRFTLGAFGATQMQYTAQPNTRRLVIITGAGLSAESGLATFRDASGIWSAYDLDKVCNYSNWRKNRAAVYAFYAARKADVLAAEPNDAHRRLATWQRIWGEDRVRLLTQNVDDLLERAGAQAVTHLHGSLSTMLCDDCFRRFDIGRQSLEPDRCCPFCGEAAPVKPGVVFFGEPSPAYHTLHATLGAIRSEDILLVVGTSIQVLSAATLIPASRAGNRLNWQVNPVPVHPELFAENVAAPPSEGLERLHTLLTHLMA